MGEEKSNYRELESENKLLKSKLEDVEQSKKRKTGTIKWIIRQGVSIFVGKGLKSAIKQTIEEYNTEEKISVDSISNLGTHVIWRLTRVGIFAIVIGLIPTCFLIIQTQYLGKQNEKIDNQNVLICKQNELINNQNIRLEQQTYLQEAGRRSSIVFLFSNVMDAIASELSNNLNTKRELSSQLIGRIISLSRSLKPYKYLQNDSLTFLRSPERGQLLINLTNANLGQETYLKIFESGDFSYSELKNYTFKNKDFGNIKLENSVMDNIAFEDCVFQNPNFSGLSSEYIRFRKCFFDSLNLSRSFIKTIYFKDVISNELSFDYSLIRLMNYSTSFSKRLECSVCYINNFSLKESFLVELHLFNYRAQKEEKKFLRKFNIDRYNRWEIPGISKDAQNSSEYFLFDNSYVIDARVTSDLLQNIRNPNKFHFDVFYIPVDDNKKMDIISLPSFLKNQEFEIKEDEDNKNNLIINNPNIDGSIIAERLKALYEENNKNNHASYKRLYHHAFDIFNEL
ncbi:pentapeptide repeat-containing protein [Aquimarina macrocephali]|uniref:hypothetical protein n=1 Tax=Aquimarina macrocephali TaxID=666563 RepID=UPI00046618A4|nr:hypothetical protein [Aquimarina macrocephali]